jgi:molecular chaperone DnaJ
VPAGVDDGDRIRLSGEGEAGRNGGPAGDLYVEIRVNPHKIFERDGSNLSCEVPVSIAAATLGGEVELPTLDGTVALKVPAGTQSGKVFRLRGKGVRTVLERFDASLQSGGERHSPRAGGWLDTVKRFFERIS